STGHRSAVISGQIEQIAHREVCNSKELEVATLTSKKAPPLQVLAFLFALIPLGHTVRADDALTARNKEIVRNFYTTVLIGRNVDAAPKFLRPDYIQHNPQVPTGLKGFMAAFRERFGQKLPADYKRELLNVIGENDMVVVYVR